jgi:hypothetical protein
VASHVLVAPPAWEAGASRILVGHPACAAMATQHSGGPLAWAAVASRVLVGLLA